MILCTLEFGLIIATFFVGNFFVGEIPAFVIVWLGVLLYRAIVGVPFSTTEIKGQVILFIIILPLLIWGIYKQDTYYYCFYQLVFAFSCLPLINKSLANKYFPYVAILFILFFTFGLVFLGAGRGGFIFGPNILYRIFGVLYMSLFISILIRGIDWKWANLILLSSYILVFIGLVATGSRGATIILLLCTIVLVIYLKNKLSLMKFIVLFSVPLVFLLYLYMDDIVGVMGRLLFFDVNNGSETVRLDMFSRLFVFFSDSTSKEILFGLGNLNRIFAEEGYYPHNLLVELIVYHGLIYFTVFMLFFLYTAFIFCKKTEANVSLLIFLPIVIGCQFSGNLTDNYIAFLAPALLYLNNHRYRCNNLILQER
ncbi:MAG: hypothetical protein RPR97_19635 [Colwellia sp.]|jgi:hypothetical protein